MVCASFCLATLPPPALAQTAKPGAPRAPADATNPDLYRLKKCFDFDERTLGNFEDTPMYWEKLEGTGLPFYNRGHFDDDLGHDAPPSFRLNVNTGNVAFEYNHLDLTVIPQSDYLIVGHVRATQLTHARAFIASYFVDRFSERIPGSERISNLAHSTNEPDEPWQRVEVSLPGEFPDAFAMRIQLWILHTYAWRTRDPAAIDPITRRDTDAAAWFDDIAVYRLPRARLHLSNPAGLIQPGKQEALLLEVNNATPQPLLGAVEIADDRGRVRHTERIVIPGVKTLGNRTSTPVESDSGQLLPMVRLASDVGGATDAIRLPIPSLETGIYTATLTLLTDDHPLLTRNVRFAILPELTQRPNRSNDLGVELGRWRRGDVAGARELLHTLGCGATKVGIPMIGALNTAEKSSYFVQISELVRALGESHIETTGVILSQSAGLARRDGESTLAMVSRDDAWRSLCSPVFAHFGGLLVSWQLGSEELETSQQRPWTPDKVGLVRDLLQRFVTFPELAVPLGISNVRSFGDEIASIAIDQSIPTADLPRMLEFLTTNQLAHPWLRIGPGGDGNADTRSDLADRARRLVLAKALAPQRVYISPPFELLSSGGRPHWQPTALYIPMRTLFWYLSGKTAIAATSPQPGVQAVVFEGLESSCMVIWSWDEPGRSRSVELYLGGRPRAVDLFGAEVPIESSGDRARFPVTPVPIIIESLDTQLALLEASFRLQPTFIQIHDAQPLPTVSFKNTFDTRIVGEMIQTPPPGWRLDPARWTFVLEPGEAFQRQLEFILPPRQLAGDYPLKVELNMHTPREATLHFDTDLTVGLRNIQTIARPYWQDADLFVEQELRNLSDRTVNFTAFCEPPGRGRSIGQFIDIAPGQTARHTYFFESARGSNIPPSHNLIGALLHFGVSEIRGDRSLDQVVEVPR